MGNPLFGNGNNNYGYGGPVQNGGLFGAFGGMMNFMNQINQFRAGLQGDPQQMVQQLRQNGKMSDEQFQYFSGIAQQAEQQLRQFMPFMRR